MSESDKSTQARVMADSIEKLLNFADQQEDFVLGAKLADVQAIFTERYLSSE